MYDKVVEKCGPVLLPIMISCDPARDKPEVLKEYLKEFHPEIIGLTGDYENIKQTCKEYRVYFSTPPTVKPGQDYLVDHSIYFYLMGKCLQFNPRSSGIVIGKQQMLGPYHDDDVPTFLVEIVVPISLPHCA